MHEEILGKLEQIVEDIKPSVKVNLDGSFRKEYGFDSLDMFSLFFEAEKKFGIKIPEEDISKHELTNVRQIIEYVKQKTNN